jgi:hypothetical protein
LSFENVTPYVYCKCDQFFGGRKRNKERTKKRRKETLMWIRSVNPLGSKIFFYWLLIMYSYVTCKKVLVHSAFTARSELKFYAIRILKKEEWYGMHELTPNTYSLGVIPSKMSFILCLPLSLSLSLSL